MPSSGHAPEQEQSGAESLLPESSSQDSGDCQFPSGNGLPVEVCRLGSEGVKSVENDVPERKRGKREVCKKTSVSAA